MWMFGSCLYIILMIYVFLEWSAPWGSSDDAPSCLVQLKVFSCPSEIFGALWNDAHIFDLAVWLAHRKKKSKKVTALGAPAVRYDDFIDGEQTEALLHFMRNDSDAVKCFKRLRAGRRNSLFWREDGFTTCFFSPGCCCQSSFYKSSYCFYTAQVCRRCVCGADGFPHILRQQLIKAVPTASSGLHLLSI